MRGMIRKDNLVHWAFVALYLVSAVLSAVPRAAASKTCLLGYKALCSFTPISTAICIAMIAFHVILAVNRRDSVGTRPATTV